MSLAWPPAETDIVLDQPRLHAFVIGVGNYPHLTGGTGQMAFDTLGLSQVQTPLHTAPAIVDWLIQEYHNPDCPLGSIELLISTPAAGAAGEAATMENVKQGFKRWVARCGSKQDNVTFFYFCGHGISKGTQFLLPQDFGNPALPGRWENCIDFDGLRVGMRSNAAQKQLFFVDACRATPFGLLTQLNVRGNPLIDAGVFDSVKCSAVYYASGEGQQAFGSSNDVSYFGKAVLSCLNGVASLQRKGKWVVDTFQLGSALGQVMEQYARRHRLSLSCNPNVTGLALIHEVKAPRVLVSVECSSPEASAAAEIVLSKGETTITSAYGQPRPFIDEVEPGEWLVDVRFQAGGLFLATPPVVCTLMPPMFEGVDIP